MHWILQNNLFNEAAYQTLQDTLDKFEIPYSIHKVIPFIGELVPAPNVGHKNIICMGSYSLLHAAKKGIWTPGVFDLEPCNFNMKLERWGTHMLNHDSKVTTFQDVVIDWNLAFIRPIEDSKVFAGKVFDAEEFREWQVKVCVLEEDYGNSLTKNTLVQVVSPKVIYQEVRCWVVHGEIVTASMYKRGDRVIYSDQVDQCYLDFACDRIAEWQPHAAFVIDVCDTPNGMRIVEINTLNSCGFYAADIPKLVMALEEGFSA